MIRFQAPGEAPITAWVRCAWKPGKRDRGESAVMLVSPVRDQDRDMSDGSLVQVLIDELASVSELGATHVLLCAADDEGEVISEALLVPIPDVEPLVRQGLAIAPTAVRHGGTLDLHLRTEKAKARPVVELLHRHALDLLALPLADGLTPDAVADLDPGGNEFPERVPRTGSGFARDPKVRQKVLERAGGRCEFCGEEGFETSDGRRYLETHHVIGLAKQGPDTTRNVIALCPKDHRRAHYGRNAKSLEAEMLRLLETLAPQRAEGNAQRTATSR